MQVHPAPGSQPQGWADPELEEHSPPSQQDSEKGFVRSALIVCLLPSGWTGPNHLKEAFHDHVEITMDGQLRLPPPDVF